MPKFISSKPLYQSSDFLAYWYDNTNAADNLSGFLSKQASDLITPQLERFRAQQQELTDTMLDISRMGVGGGAGSAPSGSIAAQSVFNLLEITQERRDGLKSIMEPGVGELSLGNSDALNLDSIRKGINTLKTISKECASFNQKVKKLEEGIEDILAGFSPNGKYKDAIDGASKVIWESYMALAEKGKVRLDKAANSQESELAKQMILDILAKHNQQIFKRAANGNIGLLKMNAGLTKMIAVLDSLPNFNENTKFTQGRRKTVDLKHNSGKTVRVSGEPAVILDKLADKILGCVNNMNGLAGELAVAYGFLQAHVLGDSFKNHPYLKASVETFGGQTFEIQEMITPQAPLLKEELQEAEKTMSEARRQVSKADVGIRLEANGTVAVLGFSVKHGSGKINDPASTGRTSLKIQSGTSLGTLLQREAHLSALEQKAIVDLLATHGGSGAPTSEAQLNKIWNDKVKPRLAQAAFVDMLTGSTLQGKAYFMIVGNTLLSMDSLIADVINNDNLSVYLSKDSSGSYLLNRSSFVTLNRWLNDPTSAPNHQAGEKRGYDAYSKVMSRLDEVIIRMALNIRDIVKFRQL